MVIEYYRHKVFPDIRMTIAFPLKEFLRSTPEQRKYMRWRVFADRMQEFDRFELFDYEIAEHVRDGKDICQVIIEEIKYG